eukprot:2641386-Alexandrium_andersonii.AAC.1
MAFPATSAVAQPALGLGGAVVAPPAGTVSRLCAAGGGSRWGAGPGAGGRCCGPPSQHATSPA